LKSGNARCHLVHNILSSSLLSSNNTYQDIQNHMFACCFYGCEMWSFTLGGKKEYRLRVFKNSVLQIIFGPKKDQVTGMEKTT